MLVAFALLSFSVAAQVPPPLQVPKAGESYVDPVTNNRVWRVTDAGVCRRSAKHFYSYWPVWNQDGTHLLIECEGWSQASSNALLIRDKDLKVMGDALRGAPDLNRLRLFWSWKDANIFYGFRRNVVWQWNPFQRKGRRVFRLENLSVAGNPVDELRLLYVSFDDRYLLLELIGPNPVKGKRDIIALATYDMQAEKIAGTLDLTAFRAYDEAVFTKDNHVWVRITDAQNNPESYRYSLDFSQHVRPAEGGHHAHGILPDGTPVAVKASSNRNCPPGSRSGNPKAPKYPNDGWKPTAVLLDERVDASRKADGSVIGRNDALPSEVLRLGCGVPGMHNLDHFSWNNMQGDRFFVSTYTYGNHETDPLANAILRVRLKFNAAGKVIGDEIDVLAQHRSGGGYWAAPRVSCNQQGTRCLFASVMSANTDASDRRPQLYVVDVPQ